MLSLDHHLFAVPFVVRGSCQLLPSLEYQTGGNKMGSHVSQRRRARERKREAGAAWGGDH